MNGTGKNKAIDYKEVAENLTTEYVESELQAFEQRQARNRVMGRTALGLATASAIAILLAIIMLPVLKIYGTSMSPTMYEGDIVVSIKGLEMEQGDLISFYYNNNILVKRVIAYAGDWVDLDPDGTVYVNGVQIDEPYVTDKAYGKCDIPLPYQVPDGCIFVMGDHRATSKDSRSKDIGSVPQEKIVGKIEFRLWPLTKFGKLK